MKPALLYAALLVTSGFEQAPLHGQDMPSVSDALADFEARGGLHDTSPTMIPAEWVAVILTNSGEYSATRVDSVLDGLTQIARESPSEEARISAAAWMVTRGRADQPTTIPGLFPRLESLFWDTASGADQRIRVMIVRAAPFQAETRDHILAFLRRVIVEESPGANYESPFHAAVQALKSMGPDGAAILCDVLGDCSGPSGNPF